MAQVRAPTHGCTFHASSSVAFVFEATRPVGSVIWYLGRWEVSWSIPGVMGWDSGRLEVDLDFDFGFLVGFFWR